jgi:hypothetical protein
MFVGWFAWNLGLTNIYLFTPSVRSWWSQLGNHGSSSLLSTMKMMVWHVMINSHEVWSLTHCHATFQSLIVQFSPQTYRYCIICVLFLYHVLKVSATFLKLQDLVVTDTAIAAQDFKNMWHTLNKTCVCHASTRALQHSCSLICGFSLSVQSVRAYCLLWVFFLQNWGHNWGNDEKQMMLHQCRRVGFHLVQCPKLDFFPA